MEAWKSEHDVAVTIIIIIRTIFIVNPLLYVVSIEEKAGIPPVHALCETNVGLRPSNTRLLRPSMQEANRLRAIVRQGLSRRFPKWQARWVRRAMETVFVVLPLSLLCIRPPPACKIHDCEPCVGNHHYVRAAGVDNPVDHVTAGIVVFKCHV